MINYSINTNDPSGFGHFNVTTDPSNPDHYKDKAFPGIAQLPSGEGDDPITDSFACEFTTYIEFPEPGVYTMILNSDDGSNDGRLAVRRPNQRHAGCRI